MIFPTSPAYINNAGQAIFLLPAVHKSPRAVSGDVRLLVIHHTGGTDSRLYLADPGDGREVSSHYLVGDYANVGVRIYKYGSETTDAMWTQGGGRLGGLQGMNPNQVAISIEIEGPPVKPAVFDAAALLAASIIRYWRKQGRELLLIRHRDIDPNKRDPDLDWTAFCQSVYTRL